MERNETLPAPTKIVYVTGCLGFIGFHVALKCLQLGWWVYGIDKVTYASNVNLLQELELYNNFKFERTDINDLERLVQCDYVINTAAETHVDNSIESSDVFLHSNINGVHHLLKLIENTSGPKPVLLHFSTDEVYGDIDEGSFSETQLLKPSNPYSATKAAADQLILAWSRTHNVPYIIVRPTNNYGIGQYVEKLIPKTIKYLDLGRKIPLHQNGEPRRTWLHVEDTADAVITIIEKGSVGEIYNIAGNYETSNIDVVQQIVDSMFLHNGDYTQFVDFAYHRPGGDVRYSIDDSKLKALGWMPKRQFKDELMPIIDYYQANFVW
jgi:dTDP-glucose 4,6-dehydratase